MTRQDAIVQYYETCEADYRLLWDLNHSLAMHAGYWDSKTKSLRDALRRENEILAERAQIRPGQRVLDAGCGVGGSAIFLARHYQCEVVGITLSSKQVDVATANAAKASVRPCPQFYQMDYTATSFPAASFDVVWAIESVCHAPNKRLFIQESARLLRPGGTLILADGFANQDSYQGQEATQMSRWLKGWGVESLTTVHSFTQDLKESGFQDIQFQDVTQNVLPSSKRLYWYSWPACFGSKVGEWLGYRTPLQTENIHGARCQYQTLKQGLWLYGIIQAKKPTLK